MLCYYYPPLGGMGSQRSQKFAFYLPEHGWRPIVVTPRSGSYLIDATLDDGASRGVEIVRTPYVDLSSLFKRGFTNGKGANGTAKDTIAAQPVDGGASVEFLRRAVRNWFYIPDPQVGWYPYATRAGRLAIETRGVDVIYSSSFPVTAHLVAKKLKEVTGKPWVADFRDLWTENHYLHYSSAFRKRIDQVIESGLLDAADVLVTVSDVWAGTLRKLTGGRKRVEVIRNGFDAGEFEGLRRNRPNKWTIAYVGNFYGAKQDPTAFFEALRRAIESNRVPQGDVEIRIVGEPDAFVHEIVTRLGLTGVTNFTGFIPHSESLAHQVDSSALLLILHADQCNPGLVPGKLYEYLGARRPIMAIMPSDFEAARIIRDTGAGVAIDASNMAEIERYLLDSYFSFKSGTTQTSNESDLSAYERTQGARKLAELLTELTFNTRVKRN
jgi:glycosyltransferase involved in cell wall biosynthesis